MYVSRTSKITAISVWPSLKNSVPCTPVTDSLILSVHYKNYFVEDILLHVLVINLFLNKMPSYKHILIKLIIEVGY